MGQYRKQLLECGAARNIVSTKKMISTTFIDKCIVRLFIIVVFVASKVHFWKDAVVDKLHAKEDSFNEEDQKFPPKSSHA